MTFTDGVKPRGHGVVDAEHHPHPLPFGKGLRQFAEADGGRGIADPVEGLKEREVGQFAFAVDGGDERDAEHGKRIRPQQDECRAAHLPHDEIDDFVHQRRSVAASMTTSVTETRFGDERACGEGDDGRHRAGFEQGDAEGPGEDGAEQLHVGNEAGRQH